MKKVSAIIITCLLVIALIAVPVMAAQTASFTVEASATSVKHGDTITVTVSTNAVEKATTGGFVFTFDRDVFEYVSGRALPTLKYLTDASGDFVYDEYDERIEKFNCGISTANNQYAGYFMSMEKDGQGKTVGYDTKGAMFEIKLKVKDTAAAGNHNITGIANISDESGTVACTAGTVVISLTCDHEYGAWTPSGAAGHVRTCGKCNTPETQAHTFGTWTTTDDPGCDTAGSKTRSCTVCNEPETASVEATGDHVYGAWTKVDETNHKRTCTTCESATKASETKTHNWGTWVLTDEPDCANPGEETATCTDNCGAEKTRPVSSTGAHGYGDWTKLDDEKHTRVCTGCGAAPQTENHNMNGVVTTPANCKTPGEKTYTCTATGCGHSYVEPIPVTEDHTFGAWTDNGADHKRVCSICDKPETAAHEFATALTAGETTHWYECVCGAKKDETAHVYDETKWAYDENNHFHGCVCGAAKAGSAVAHTWDAGVITLKPTNKREGEKTYTCSVCNGTKIEKIPQTSTPGTGDETLVIPMVVLAVLSACGLALTVVARKRASR